MKMRMFSILLAAALLLGMIAGCGAEPVETTPTEPEAEILDLEAVYNQGMEVLAQLGDDAPILFPETNIEYINNFYVGIADIELKQFYAGVAPVTNAPFEIVLVEVANASDVPAVLEIFQARVDGETDDTAYPENAEAWLNNCKITSRGNYVFLAVLMGSCEIPAEFILD